MLLIISELEIKVQFPHSPLENHAKLYQKLSNKMILKAFLF